MQPSQWEALKELKDEIMTLCRAVACFRCDAATAHHLKSVLPVKPEAQQRLSFHHFSFYAAGDKPVTGVARTRHMDIPDRSEKASEYSVSRLGEYVSLDRYYTQRGGSADVILTPLEFGILNLLRSENRDMDKGEITEMVQRRYAADPRMVSSALNDALISANGFAKKHDVMTDDGDSRFESRYTITKSAISRIFSKAAAGRRSGGDLHLAAIFMVMDVQTALGSYCIPDLGKGAAMHADLLIFSPRTIEDADSGSKDDNGSSGNSSAGRLYHPSEWSERVVALEVETDPGKHWGQAVTNWEKSAKLGYFVWYVVFSEEHRDGLHRALQDRGVAPSEYAIQIIDKQSLLSAASSADQKHISRLSEAEAAILKTMINADGRTATLKYLCEAAWQHDRAVIGAALKSLQAKGVLYRADGDEKTGMSARWAMARPAPKVEDDRGHADTSASASMAPPSGGMPGYHTDESSDMRPEDDQDTTRGNGEGGDSTVAAAKARAAADDDNTPQLPAPAATESGEPAQPAEPEEDALGTLDSDMLLHMWADNHTSADVAVQRGISHIEAELQRRGYVIKSRAGRFFLARLPGSDTIG